MWEYAKENPGYFIIICLCLITVVERVISAVINRNKPNCDCSCSPEDEDDDNVPI